MDRLDWDSELNTDKMFMEADDRADYEGWLDLPQVILTWPRDEAYTNAYNNL